MAAAVEAASALRRDVAGLAALELMDGPSLRLVADHLAAPPPVAPDAGAYLLVEVDAPAEKPA